jgi:hypothetical protein
MDRTDISEGITLFEFSDTGQQSPRAKDVIKTLTGLYQNNRIVFQNIGKKTLRARWSSANGGHLRVNTVYMDSLPSTMRLGALSLELVHEGTHATLNFPASRSLYDEMAARILPIHYFRELSGPGVFNEASDPPRPGQHTGIVRVPPGSLPQFDTQSAALKHDQLVDYLLSRDGYSDSDFVNPQWIVENLTNWHGLTNRWPDTRGLYISVLSQDVNSHFTRVIVDIMESIDSRADWDTMMSSAGSLRAIQLALDDLSARPQFSGRIAALERRWGVRLTEDPPAPPKRKP